MRNVRADEEVAVVLTMQVKVDGEYPVVVETLNTPFLGPGARQRAENFRRSEETRDFTAADGWQWTVWANARANEVYGEQRTRALLGED